MKILLTGSTGFIGKHLLRHLLAAGHVVTTPTRYDPITAIREPFDAVIDLAWSGVSAKWRNDWMMQSANVARFGVMLAMLPVWKPGVFIGFGSQAEYGQDADRIFALHRDYPGRRELEPKTAYGAAKLACWNMMGASCPNGARNIWFRLFSVYGPGESDEWLIPSTIRKMRSGEPLQFTEGFQEMDYLHVDSVCRDVLSSLEKPEVGGAVDLATGKPVSVRKVIETLADIIKPSQPLELGAIPLRDGQIMRARACSNYWQSQPISLRDGLQQVVDSMS